MPRREGRSMAQCLRSVRAIARGRLEKAPGKAMTCREWCPHTAGGKRDLRGKRECRYSTTILPFSDQCLSPQNLVHRISYSPSELAANSKVTGRSGVAFPFSFRTGI